MSQDGNGGKREEVPLEHIVLSNMYSMEASIALLEKLANKSRKQEEQGPLTGLRTVQLIRTKVKGHSGSSEAKKLEKSALMEYETFSNHFLYVCGLVVDELGVIEDLFS